MHDVELIGQYIIINITVIVPVRYRTNVTKSPLKEMSKEKF